MDRVMTLYEEYGIKHNVNKIKTIVNKPVTITINESTLKKITFGLYDAEMWIETAQSHTVEAIEM